MYKFFKQMLLLLGCFVSLLASGQNLISPITINLPANPPANTSEWATTLPPVMILAQTNLVNGQINGAVQESKIFVYITKAGTKVCGTYSPQTAPMASFNASIKNWSGANVLSLLGQDCTLQPGSYELCVQFYGYNGSVAGAKLLGEKCKAFTIVDKKQEAASYSPPQNIFPNNGKVFTEKETKAPIVFRWTPVIPKPKESVKYKLRVWEVEEGQNATQAVKMNSPLLEKEVKEMTQSVDRIIWPPRSGSERTSYIWNVEASRQNQMGEVEMLGSSEPTAFTTSSQTCINLYNVKVDSIICKDNNQYKVCATFSVLKSGYGLSPTSYTTFPTKIIDVQFFDQTNTAVSLAFAINVNKNEGQTYSTCQTITIPAGVTSLTARFNSQVQTTNPSFDACNIASRGDTIMPSCRCNLCDSNVVKWTLPTQINYSYSLTNNTLTLGGPLSFGPYPIVKLSTEIVDFYWYTEGDCKKCNNNDFYFGNLISGNLTSMLGGTSVAGPGGTPIPSSHQLDFISPTLSGLVLNGNVNLNISLPPQTQLSCCTDCFRFCIRYTATFMQNGVCKTCSIVKCYETKRVHKKVGIQMFPPLNDCGERGVTIVKDKNDTKEN